MADCPQIVVVVALCVLHARDLANLLSVAMLPVQPTYISLCLRHETFAGYLPVATIRHG